MLDSATANTATANTATANKASISFFGAIDTPSSTIIEYADHNSLFIRSCNGSTAIEKNIFEYLDDTLEAYKEHEVHVEYSNFDLPKDQRLPFNLTGGVFGYLGYELRSETTHILTHSSSSSGDGRKYDYGSTRSSAFKRNKWVGRLQHPLALFMAPSRYIVYDHSLSLIYVVACADERTDATDAANDLLAKVNSINSKNRQSSTLSKAVVPSPLPSANEKDLTSDKSYLDYYRAVDVCQEHIQMGRAMSCASLLSSMETSTSSIPILIITSTCGLGTQHPSAASYITMRIGFFKSTLQLTSTRRVLH